MSVGEIVGLGIALLFTWLLPTWVAYNIGKPIRAQRWTWLAGFTLGWIGALLVLGLTRKVRRQLRFEQQQREEARDLAETGMDAETRKLRAYGLE
jgi:hypothetical protein